jgi:hypothetical protein
MRTKELAQDEFIVDHAVVDFATNTQDFDLTTITRTGENAPGLRILVLTNQAYYLSAPMSVHTT